MLNFYEDIRNNPGHYQQIAYDHLLFAEYKCPLEQKKFDLWSENHYFVHVLKGRKIWHTPYGSCDLREGDCILVKKGACIVEQFFDEVFCLMVFFFPENFVIETVRELDLKIEEDLPSRPIIPINMSDKLRGFFQSMAPYFLSPEQTDKELIRLKFKELIINLALSKENPRAASYFAEIRNLSRTSLQEIMEFNFSYNLKLLEYARLCGRSLSSFKRDFKRIYKTPPKQWLMERRLNFAKMLLETTGKSISEVIFESGFENLSHFSRAFKEKFRLSPTQLRKTLANPAGKL